MALAQPITAFETPTAPQLDELFVGTVERLEPTCTHIALLAGKGPGVALAQQLASQFRIKTTLVENVGDLDTDSLLRLAASTNAEVVVGVGGGNAIDRSKIAAKFSRAKNIAIPTSLSQDGLFAQYAVLRSVEGKTERYLCSAPDAVIPAHELIDEAPDWMRSACIGDLISNFSAVADCRLAGQNGFNRPSGHALAMSVRAAEMASQSDPYGLPSALLPAVRVSGEAMCDAGSSQPCSGAEHKIAHAIDLITKEPGVHGLNVGLATVFVSALRSQTEFDHARQIANTHHLPLRLEELAIPDEVFVEAVELAKTLRRDRFTVLDIADVPAERTAEILGFMDESS